jgi:PAS domain S-box-containing protein
MMNWLVELFPATSFLPHRFCIANSQVLLTISVISNLLIFIAYFSIPIALEYLRRKREEQEFKFILWLFAAFILACGTTHLIHVITYWQPWYWLEIIFDAITAIISIYTAIHIFPLLPHLLDLPNPEQLQALNQQLKLEIAERETIEANLRQEIAFSKVLIDSLPGVFYRLDEKGRLVDCNDTLAHLLGEDGLKMAQANVLAAIAPHDEILIAEKIAEGFANGETEVQAELKLADGSFRSFHFIGKVLKQDNHTHLLGTGIDITEHKQKDIQYQSIIEASFSGFWSNNFNGQFLEVNTSLCKMLGYSAAELLSMKITDIEAKETPEDTAERIQKIIQTGHDRFETQHRHKDGSIADVEVNVLYIKTLGERFFVFVNSITERKKAEAELLASQNLLNLSQEYGEIGSWEYDFVQNKQNWSRMTFQIAQIPVQESPTWDDFLALIHPDDKQFVLDSHHAHLTTREKYDVEYRTTLADGKIHWFRSAGRALFAADGTPLKFIGIVQDITERKIMEEELRSRTQQLQESKNFFQLLTQVNPVGIYQTDAAGDCVFVNTKWCEMTGLTYQQAHGKGWTAALMPDDREKVYNEWENSVREQKNFSLEYRFQQPNGKITWVYGVNTPIRDDKNVISGYIGTVVDIGKRKQMEEKLRTSEQKLRLLIEQMPLALGLTNMNGKLLYINERFKRTFGYTIEDIPTVEDWYALAYPDEAYRQQATVIWTEAVNQAMLNNSEISPAEYHVTCKNGDVKVMIISGIFFENGLLATFTDITERKQTELEIEKSLSLLHATLESSSDAILVVDLNNHWVLHNQNFIQLWGVSADVIAKNDDMAALQTILEQLTDPENFLQRVHELYAHPEAISFDVFSFKNGKIIERGSIPQRINDKVVGRVWSFRDITERALAQCALQRESEKNLALLRNASDGIHILDVDGNILEVSDSFCTCLGYSREEMMGMNVRRWDAGFEDDEELKNIVKAQFSKQEVSIFETLHRCKNGKIITVEVSGFPLQLDGKPVLFNSSRDITARKQLEMELRQREGYQRALLNNFPFLIWLKDKDCRFLAVNQGFAEACGYASEDLLLGKSDFDIWPEELAKSYRADDKLVMASGKAKTIEELVEVNGELVWFETYKSPVIVEGEIIGTVGFSRDITERKAAEIAIAESKNLLLRIIDTVPMRVFWKDCDLNYLGCNMAFAKDAGMSHPTDLIGKDDYQMAWKEQAELYRNDDKEVISSDISKISYDEQQTTPTGGKLWLRTSKITLKNQYNQIIGLLGVYEDITERKLMELALTASETRFRTIIEISPVPMALNDDAGNITYLNPAFVQTFGYDLNDIPTLQDWWPKAYPDETYRQWVAETWQAAVDKSEREGQPFTPLEINICCKNGTMKTALISASRISKLFKDLRLVVFYDISERKQIEEKLQNSELRLRTIIETEPECIKIVDAKGCLMQINAAGLAMIEADSEEQVVGNQIKNLIAPEYRIAFAKMHEQVIAGEKKELEFEIRGLKGGRRWLETHAVPMLENGKIVHLAVTRDITQRKLAEAELRELNRDFVTFLENTSDFIYFKDQNSRIRFCSQTLANITHHDSWRDLVGKHDLEVFPAETAQIYYEEELPVFTQGIPLLNKIDPYYNEDGSKGWVSTSKWPVFDFDNQKVIGIFGVSRDITQLKQAEQDLLRSNTDLEQFAYSVSHDMRQPLRSVTGHLQLLARSLKEKLDEEESENLNFALEGARRMDTMILSLLDYSRVGRKTERKAWINSREVLDDALMFLTPAITEAQITVNVSGEWTEIFASYDELTRLLMNLIGNAIKYREPHQPLIVEIHSIVKAKSWKVSIRDYGIGINPLQINRLFQFFSRLQSRSRFEGTGMGLALCKRIVEHHEGKIWCESTGEGMGACFSFQLPLPDKKTTLIESEVEK